MLLNTRRRALGLILAAGLGLRLPFIPRARAAQNDCFASKPFGPWKGLATDSQAGARINQMQFDTPDCDLHADIQVATSYDAKIVLYGDRDKIKLPKKFLIDPANRLIVRTADGKTGFSGLFSVIGPVDHFDARVSPKQVSLGTPQSLTVSARDSAGNLVQSYASSNTVLWAALDSGWLTFADGRAETTFTMPFAAREFAIEVLDTGNGMYAYSNTFDVIGSPDHLEGSFRRTDHRTGCASVKGNLTLKMEDNAV